MMLLDGLLMNGSQRNPAVSLYALCQYAKPIPDNAYRK
ncbi:hypothetical protein J2Z22_002548 [Paenibacillus forsythiae]|uniref:Uncharacterized protein n=1 Tax=Paenibacillus forsythiae TaxID=365616 RepID=A0ABU3H859_9BACL|nr:hypothetical protein [Paenibacillus forsythiae]